MRTYRFAGLTLASDFPLPPLLPWTGRPSMTIALAKRRPPAPDRAWAHSWRQPDGRPWMQIAKQPPGYFVQFPDYADFEVAARTITCHPRPGVPIRTVRHLLLDQVLPACLAGEDRLVLHASAVELNGVTIGFLGAAGAGKSTLAAAMTTRGAGVITDDALVIERRRSGIRVVATYPGLRLWPDAERLVQVRRGSMAPVAHYTRKRRWSGRAVAFADSPKPLGLLCLLARGAVSRVGPLRPRDALMALVRYSMLIDAADSGAVGRSFDLASLVARRVPVVRLTVGRGRRALRQACDAVEGRIIAESEA